MSSSPFSVSGRVFIITGGAGLLGKEYTLALSQAGAHVVIADLDYAAAKQIARQVSGASALALTVDVTDAQSVKQMVARTMENYGRLDGLVNNAALNPKFDPDNAASHTTTFEDFPLAQWNAALQVDLTGMFLCSQAVAPVFLAQQSGTIVNVSSIYGLVGPDQRLYETEEGERGYKPVTYSVTKSAVQGFTRYLATYWGNKGIRVNTLSLGGVNNNHDEAFKSRYGYRTPMGRMAELHECVNALLFLLSDASGYMTGANLVVDGGWTAW